MTDPDLAEVVRRELLLLDPARRSSAPDVAALLHPDFREHGASGRVWDRAAIAAALGADPIVSGEATDLEPVALPPRRDPADLPDRWRSRLDPQLSVGARRGQRLAAALPQGTRA
jgi:hypothetical protein